MLLAIDSGNTNIVFALFDGETVRGEWRSSTTVNRTADEFGVWLIQLMAIEGIDRKEVTACIIASVVPAVMFNLKQLCRKYFGREALVVGEEGVKLGLNILLDRPEEVGADRLVNAVAAHKFYKGPLIVIDFGTATTSTWWMAREITAAAPSRPVSISRSRRCMRRPPNCRASPSAGRAR